MNLFGIAITYAVCWWLVLFMVLPFGVQMAENPGAGHARSAPVRPMMKRKLIITSLLTILPTLLFYFIVSDARAAEPDIYSTNGATSAAPSKSGIYQTKNAGKGCRPATIGNGSAEVPVNVNVPISPYFDASKQGSNTSSATAVASEGAIGLGKGQVNSDGTLTMDGKKIGSPNPVGDCPPDADDTTKKAK